MFGDDDKDDFEEHNYGRQVFSMEPKWPFMSATVQNVFILVSNNLNFKK